MRPVLSGQGVRELDRKAEELGMPSLLLMESAGRGAAEVIRQVFPKQVWGRVVVLAGKGGNGGDALCAARWLGLWGAEPLAIVLGGPVGVAAEQAQAFSACFPERLVRVETEGELAAWRGEVSRAGLVIDGILGVGVEGPARGLARAAIELIGKASAPVVAIDLPSGLSADSGEVPGPAVRAELTLAMGALKPCHLLPPAAEHSGRVEVVPVAYPPPLWEGLGPCAWVLSDEDCARALPPRPRFGHKGTFGRVLVVGGAVGMAGAVSLAARAAMQAGAGLVHVVVPEPIYPVVEAEVIEALVHPAPAEEGMFSPQAAELVLSWLPMADVVLVGPGLGRGPGPAEVVHALLTSGHPKLVLDADALFHLAQSPKALTRRHAGLILTPHPGEFARLVGKPAAEVVSHKIEQARARAVEWRAVIALKGPPTAIASPEGEVYLSITGNTALAHGGSGDVLAGLIAGLWASGAQAFPAAWLGAFVHGRAAELLTRQAAERAVLPGELFSAIPRALADLEGRTEDEAV
ncbi:NAD(P)H-hydrate dehydratase [Candidatus Bipolaricaulota bacterium]|nr:NAD(P)H-hydrate dehydratase [Candidatus Bipolaricaulota bacterium]